MITYSDGLQPNYIIVLMASNLEAMASDLMAMASNLIAMAKGNRLLEESVQYVSRE